MQATTKSKEMGDGADINNLWNRFLEGNDKAYAQLYNLYIDDLFAYGMHFTSDRESVRDCIQEVFITIYKNRLKQRMVENVKCYLFTSLKNELFDLFKKSVAYYQIETIEPVFNTEYSVEDLFVKTEIDQHNKAKIKEILQSLTPRQHEVLYYRYVEEMSYEEIGQLMQMNYQSVRNLLHRSIRKARDLAPKYVFCFLVLIQLFYI